MNSVIKHFIAKIIVFSLVVLSTVLAKNELPAKANNPHDEVWLTIVVHGIINAKPHISLTNIIRVMQDNLENTVYQKTVEITRNDPFFYQYHPMQELGLQKINMESTEPGAASTAFAHIYNGISSLNQEGNKQNIYYTYGWSGMLGSKVRSLDAEPFYQQLSQELATYHQQGIYPKIRIIGYSHGGHVALHLATVHEKNKYPALEKVDEVVLLGLPVICDTDYLVTHPLFKKIYHFYSPGDRVQIADFLAYHRFLSNRTFKSRPDFQVPDKVVQIELRTKRLARTTKQYSYPHYPRWLIRSADFGHTELFSFGWIYNYRKYIPFYPLPAIAYVGYILQAIEQFDPTSRHVSVDIWPFESSMFLKAYDTNKSLTYSFLTQEQQKYFADLAKSYEPLNFNVDIFNERTAQTVAQAQELLKAEEECQKQAMLQNCHSEYEHCECECN